MPDEEIIQEDDLEGDVDDILAGILNFDDDEEESPHQDLIDEAEGHADEEDAITAKLSKKVESMERRFERDELRRSVDTFMVSASDTEKALMKELAGDITSVHQFEKYRNVVSKQAARLEAKAKAAEAQANSEAKQRAATAWGVGPIGGAPAVSQPDEAEIQERINRGDPLTGVAALMQGQPLMGRIFQ